MENRSMGMMVKLTMKVVMKDRTYHGESLITLIYKIETMLNSRPLLPCSIDLSDFDALTPNDFIIKKFETVHQVVLTKTILLQGKKLTRYSHIRMNFGEDS